MAAGRHWDDALKDAARRMRAERGATAAAIARALRDEHQVQVPTGTVSRWIAQPLKRRPSGDSEEDLRQVARRAVALAESEITRLERHGRRPIDLDRLAKLARILSSLESVKLTAPKVNGRRESEALRLEDLGSERLSEAEEPAKLEPVPSGQRS